MRGGGGGIGIFGRLEKKIYPEQKNFKFNNNNIFNQIPKLQVLFDIGNEINEHNYTANTLFNMF